MTGVGDLREPEKVTSIDAEYLSGERFPYQEDIALVRGHRPRGRHARQGPELARGR